MKRIKYLLLPLSIMLSNLSQADNLPAKEVSIPFNNEILVDKNHAGLFFDYDMNSYPTKKIVCKLSNVYKSWFEYPNQGSMEESGTFGDYQTVVFTSKGFTGNPNESTSIYHSDSSGMIKINETLRDKPSLATASCAYEIDNTK